MNSSLTALQICLSEVVSSFWLRVKVAEAVGVSLKTNGASLILGDFTINLATFKATP